MPRRSPRSAVHPVSLLVRSQIPTPSICCAEAVSFRSSSIGHMSSIAAGIGLPRSWASSVVPMLRPPPALGPLSRVEAEHVSPASEPLESRVAVLDRHRVTELGCETVLHGGRDDVVLQHPLNEHGYDGPSAHADHAATVNEIDARTRPTLVAIASEHRNNDLPATVTDHRVIGDLDWPARDDLIERRRTSSRRSELRDGIGPERREERGHCFECGFELSVERWTGMRSHLDPPLSGKAVH